ncbi:MAG: hypothetical protein AB1345_01840 [Chloroflexota bacterium]
MAEKEPSPMINTLQPNEFQMVKAEYDTLREEILKRIDIRHQIVSLHLIIAGTFLSFGLQKDASPYILLVYPILTMFIAAGWARNDIRIGHIGAYLRDHYEVMTDYVRWETHRQAKDVKRRWLWLSGLRIFSALGLFLITQLIAVGYAFSRVSFTLGENIFLVLDVIVVILTFIFLFMRRGV